MLGIRNIVPTIQGGVALSVYPPASDNSELIKLFVTGRKGTYQETFVQKFQFILEHRKYLPQLNLSFWLNSHS